MPTLITTQRKRPWHKKQPKDTSEGFNGKNKEKYNDNRWRNYSIKYRKENRRCYVCGQLQHNIRKLAVDHIVRIEDGGSFWDSRNHGSICKSPCHMSKSARERHGYKVPFILNDKGEKIPSHGSKPDKRNT